MAEGNAVVPITPREPDTWRATVRGVTHMLVVPQGFTLSVTGVFAITAGHRGFPEPVAIWLFILGTGLGFCAATLTSGAHREPANRPVTIVGLAMMNVLPAIVVPAACGVSWWISDERACFFSAGACASLFYLAGLTAFIVVLGSTRGVGLPHGPTDIHEDDVARHDRRSWRGPGAPRQ